MEPYRAVPARSRMAGREISAEVSSGGLAGSSFVGSLVNLFPGWRVREGWGRSGQRLPSLLLADHLGRGLYVKLLGELLGMVWPLSLFLVGSMSKQARVGFGERCIPWEKEKEPQCQGEQESVRTEEEEGAARNDSLDLTHAAGAEGALGKRPESPPRPNRGTTLLFNYLKNPEEHTRITPTSQI